MPLRPLAAFVLLLIAVGPSVAADWPMWRYDANRSAASPHELPAKLHPQWVRHDPPLTPAWPDQSMMPFDAAYEPVVVGKSLFVGSSRTDSVTAIDTTTGEPKWRFLADGPVRFAPLVWEGRVYFVCDDGHLYCVDAEKGTLLWKFRGGPGDRRILGNERLVSMWPARGAPVIADGTVYFAASIWPFMGIFIHALDARTGTVVWTNDGDGSIYIKQPHSADSFAGVAPQGPMAILGDYLLVTGGRSVPACYDRKTGKLIHYKLNDNNKKGGGSTVAAIDDVFVNGGGVFELATGKHLGKFPTVNVLAGATVYGYEGGQLKALDLSVADERPRWGATELATHKLADVACMIQAGSRLYLGLPTKVMAIAPPRTRDALRVEWEAAVEGRVASLIAADDRLFATTLEGHIYCFGADQIEPRVHRSTPPDVAADKWTDRANAILDATGMREGYCVSFGVGSGRLVTELVRQSQLRVIAVEPDPVKVKTLRERLIALDLYGTRASVHLGDPMTFELPPYLASLVVSEDLAPGAPVGGALARRVFDVLRPYGGTACLPVTAKDREQLVRDVAAGGPAKVVVRDSAAGTLLVREGGIPGAGNWTHEHADAANTRVSRDRVVKAPLGLLWFGGPTHEGILPRHGHGPQPQVIDGRLLIEGVDSLRALDIYTGRLLWESALPGLGSVYNNLAHQPGANAGGTNYISTSNGIYVAYKTSCVVLNPETGKRIAEYHLPAADGKPPARWGYINVVGDYLIGGAASYTDRQAPEPTPGAAPKRDPFNWRKLLPSAENQAASNRLVVMDRHTGKVLWEVFARHGFRHNATCVGGGRVYTIDRPPRSLKTVSKPLARLLVLDLKTGATVWDTDADVFGTYLSYSEDHDVLVETGRVARDTLPDEAKGMCAYRAGDGEMLWQDPALAGPAMLLGETILRDKGATHLLTGLPVHKPHPLTGEPEEWTWSRNYGCNTPSAAQNLMTFRSGAAGYCDLATDAGTGNFGGIRSGCTNNLIVAGGVICAPDYTRTCTCSYQNQTSIALVPMADAEMWTSFGRRDFRGRVRRVGVAFGAPGDRKADDGTLWLEYPSVGGLSPVVDVKVNDEPYEYFRRHSSRVTGGLPWVAASGVQGVEGVTLALGSRLSLPRRYTVRLHFAEPDAVAPGERVFDVAIQGKLALDDLDIAKETGGTYRGLVKEVSGVMVGRELEVLFRSVGGSKRPPLVCGIEVVADGW